MPKYINADYLKVTLLNFLDTTEATGMRIGTQFCIHALDEMPAADVVEVVRCKDCKYWVVNDCALMFPVNVDMRICPDDFCSFAERKEAEE